ncbi:glycosyltransferase, partial [bacterium]|nr:glycosyltransferase [bacterium]
MLQIIFPLFLVFSVIYLLSIVMYLAGLFYSGNKSFFTRPYVSVVIAIKNEISRLPALLKCVREQDYPDDLLEIIIVDNG